MAVHQISLSVSKFGASNFSFLLSSLLQPTCASCIDILLFLWRVLFFWALAEAGQPIGQSSLLVPRVGITIVIRPMFAIHTKSYTSMVFPTRTSSWWCTMIWLKTSSRSRSAMQANGIADFFRNPTKGIVINHPDGDDVYHGVPHDYTGLVGHASPCCFPFTCRFY